MRQSFTKSQPADHSLVPGTKIFILIFRRIRFLTFTRYVCATPGTYTNIFFLILRLMTYTDVCFFSLLPPPVPLAITPTFRPCTHTSDDSYMYQLSLVVATATVSSTTKYVSRHSQPQFHRMIGVPSPLSLTLPSRHSHPTLLHQEPAHTPVSREEPRSQHGARS